MYELFDFPLELLFESHFLLRSMTAQVSSYAFTFKLTHLLTYIYIDACISYLGKINARYDAGNFSVTSQSV